MVYGRIAATGARYNDAMGPGYERRPESWLSPKASDALGRALRIDPSKPIPPSGEAARPGTPESGGSGGWSRDPNTGNYRDPSGRIYDPNGRPLQ
jgi:hypothetical protein